MGLHRGILLLVVLLLGLAASSCLAPVIPGGRVEVLPLPLPGDTVRVPCNQHPPAQVSSEPPRWDWEGFPAEGRLLGRIAACTEVEVIKIGAAPRAREVWLWVRDPGSALEGWVNPASLETCRDGQCRSVWESGWPHPNEGWCRGCW